MAIDPMVTNWITYLAMGGEIRVCEYEGDDGSRHWLAEVQAPDGEWLGLEALTVAGHDTLYVDLGFAIAEVEAGQGRPQPPKGNLDARIRVPRLNLRPTNEQHSAAAEFTPPPTCPFCGYAALIRSEVEGDPPTWVCVNCKRLTSEPLVAAVANERVND